MGFVGGGGNIAIATTLPPSSFVYCIVNIKYLMDFLYLIIYGFLRFRFLDVETNPGQRRPVPAACRILCCNVRSLAGNLGDLTVASYQYDILLLSETLVSDMRHVSEVLVPSFGRPVLLCRGKMPRARGMAAYIRDGYGAFRQPKFECGCCEMLFFRVCGVRQKIFEYSLYRNPDLDDRIFYCLQASMGDLNGHHQEWLGSTTTNRHGVAAFDFVTVSG